MTEKETLARTIYGEARNQGLQGMRAVANVIVNRASVPCWWGKDIGSVCLKPFQFSCWNKDDPNYNKIIAICETDEIFKRCLEIADEAIAGTLEDLTYGATHYHTRAVNPNWKQVTKETVRIGDHVFYKDIK